MDTGRFFDKTRSLSRLFFLIPLILILGLFAFFFSPALTKDFVEGEGVIYKVEETTEYDADNNARTEYVTYFKYTVDGQEYDNYFQLLDKYEVGATLRFYYNPKNPVNTSTSKNNAWLWLVFLGLAVLAAIYTVYSVIRDSRRMKQVDALRAQRDEMERREAQERKAAEKSATSAFNKDDYAEYYFRFDGRAFMPGYLIEDKNRVPLFIGKQTQNLIVVPRKFEFTNSRTHETVTHKIGHIVTSRTGSGEHGGSEFTTRSWFKYDGVNIWDYIHNNGILIDTDAGEKLFQMEYTLTKNGRFLAKVLMTSKNVHEEDEENAKVNIVNKMFYRIWTNETDLELIFLTVFAIAETNQIVYS